MKYTSIRPGQIWLDTEGKRIHAHGGSILPVGDTFYWYGENKEKSVPDSGIYHWGVRCYASKDLYNWGDKGLIIPPTWKIRNPPCIRQELWTGLTSFTIVLLKKLFCLESLWGHTQPQNPISRLNTARTNSFEFG